MNNFKSAILKFSISKSASNEGEIGWIKETLLSEEINLELKKTNIKSFTKPFKSPNGYLILRINEKKEMQTNYNLQKELKDLVRFEKNKQLNQFSLLFFKNSNKTQILMNSKYIIVILGEPYILSQK